MSTNPSSNPNTSAIPRIFVSHSHHDNSFCRPFVAHLRSAIGLTDPDHIFYDETSLHLGDEWLARIQREVFDRPIFLVILTPRSIVADYVRTETSLALRETIAHKDTRLLISLLIEDCDPNTLAPLLLNYQMADFLHTRYDTAFDTLVATLRARFSSPAAQPPVISGGPSPAPLAAHGDGLGAQHPAPAANPLVARLLPGIREAAEQRAWHLVIDRADYLIDNVSAAELPNELYRLVGCARFEYADYAGARAALETALTRDPADVDLLTMSARACLRLNDPVATTTAAKRLKDALALADNPQQRLAILRDYAEALSRLQQWDLLLRRCDEALALLPDDTDWLDLRLHALTKLGRNDDALTLLRQLTAHNNSMNWWLERARLARAVANDDDEVRAAIDAASSLTSANDPRIAQARNDLLPPPIRPDQLPTRIIQARNDRFPSPIPPDRFPARLATLGFIPRRARDPQTGQDVEFIVPPLCDVPVGPFEMGSDRTRDPQARSDEPLHAVTLPAFRIARYPVTVAEYACFVRAGHAAPQSRSSLDWSTQLTRLDHPVTCATWHEATAYAAWLAARTGDPWRLPDEVEWEKAARWEPRSGKSRIYPWGDAFDPARCNTAESGIKTTTHIGSYPADDPARSGASPCGAEEMAGDVWEWTTSLYNNSTQNRVVRGGSWVDGQQVARAAYRNNNYPEYFSGRIGFRLVLAAPVA